jgi:Putative metal-binding motif
MNLVRPAPVLRLGGWTLAVVLAGCGVAAVDPTAVASAQQALLCQNQQFCYVDADHDSKGAGAGVFSCNCNSVGYSFDGTDCDDTVPTAWRHLSCYRDTDKDGKFGTSLGQVCAGASCDSSGFASSPGDDCDDSSSTRWQTLRCYPDADGDHYGSSSSGGATTVCAGKTCADGTTHEAASADDCDDTKSSIHPYRSETSSNGIDDNCDGRIDEPVFLYNVARPPESLSDAQLSTIDLRITDAATIANLNANSSVRFTLTYEPLEHASGVAVVTPPQAAMVAPSTWSPGGVLSPSILHLNPNSPTRGFTARTVYRLKVQLFDFTTVTPIGPETDWFYMVTGGTPAMPSDTLNWARVDLVLRALVEYGDSQEGEIGPNGTVAPDGTRFVSSLHPAYNKGDELTWCDWFYHYLGAMVTDGLDGSIAANPVVEGGNTFWQHTMKPNNIPNAFRDPLGDGCGTALVDVDDYRAGDGIDHGCQNYTATQVQLDRNDNQFYSNIATDIYYDAVKSLPSNQAMGNYQGMDHHAGMFLAFDAAGDGTFDGPGRFGTVGAVGTIDPVEAVGTVWSIEGNYGDRVKVIPRPATSSTINGFGKLTLKMVSP